MMEQLYTISKEKFQRCFDEWKSTGRRMLKAKWTILNNINFSFVAPLRLTVQFAGVENMLTASLQRSKTPLPPTIILDMTLNNLMVRLQSWNSGECEVPLH